MWQLNGGKYQWLALSILLLAQTVQAWQFVVGSERAPEKAQLQQPDQNMQIRTWLLHLNDSMRNIRRKLPEGDVLQKAFGRLVGEDNSKLPLLDVPFASEIDDPSAMRMELLQRNFLVVMLVMNFIMFIVMVMMYKAFRAHSQQDNLISHTF